MDSTVVIYENDFERLLAEAVDEGLTDLLGESVRKAIYDHLEKGYSISKDQIPTKLDDFGLVLEKTFGVTSRTVSKIIVKKLYTKLGLPFVEKTNYGFLEYVREAKMKH